MALEVGGYNIKKEDQDELSDCHIEIEIEEIPPCYEISETPLRALLVQLLQLLHLQAFELSLRFVSASDMQIINQQYRNRNQPTDVLSFPQQTWDPPLCLEEKITDRLQKKSPIPQLLGDIVICLEKAEENAADIGHDLARETCFLLIHGLLHLCGHDHEYPEEEEQMIHQQQLLFAQLEAQTPIPWFGMVTRKGPT